MSSIVKTPGVCGGNACVGDTRIAVWTLQRLREMGAEDRQLIENYPSLSLEDLRAVWDYVASHEAEIQAAILRQGPASRTARGGSSAGPVTSADQPERRGRVA